MATFWWRVEPAWPHRTEATWLSHAQRSTRDFPDVTSDTVWRHAKSPALCGAVPPDGVWSRVGNDWHPARDRSTLERIRAAAPSPLAGRLHVRHNTLPPPCPECERRTTSR